jgi:hypothetical protein
VILSALVSAVTSTAAASGLPELAVWGPLGVFAAFALPAAVIVYRDQRRQITELTAAVSAATDRGDRLTSDAVARADRLAQEKNALTEQVMRDVVPVMTRTVQVMSDVHDALQRRGPRDGR